MAGADEQTIEPAALGPQGSPTASASVQAHGMADAIRALALDAIAWAGSGDPGFGMADPGFVVGMADVATTLWTRFHKFDAADPLWPDRDRFVLSSGQGALLLYALLTLTGHPGMTPEVLQSFGRLHSPASGQPEYGHHPAIECTTGTPAQGYATAVGLALAERNLAARFGRSLVDHRTWVIAAQEEMMEGVSHEAAALAGQLGLSKLTVLYAEALSTPEDAASIGADDVLRRFVAYGWAVKRVDGHDAAQVHAALSFAVRSKKPTLIACAVFTDPDAPTAAASRSVAPPAPDASLQGAAAVPPAIDAHVQERWHLAGSRGATARRSWLKRLARHNQRGEFERVLAGRLPDTWHEVIGALKQAVAETRTDRATAASSRHCLEQLTPVMPELIGGGPEILGSEDAAQALPAISTGNYGGRRIDFGAREHGMAAAATGMALHGGIVPYVATLCIRSDNVRPALRLGAIMRQRVVYVLGHDSISVGIDGPAHQPVEQLPALRAMPHVHVFRPADAMETVECWELALRRQDGPSVLVLSRQALPLLRTELGENRCARGGYVLAEAEGPRQATVIATGSEVSMALAARERLAAEGVAVAVVSLPCWELFAQQDPAYCAQVLGGAHRLGLEAATGFGWAQWLGPEGTFIGMPGFGASGRSSELYDYFGITADAVVAAIRSRLT